MTRSFAARATATFALLCGASAIVHAQDNDATIEWRTDPDNTVWSQAAAGARVGSTLASPAEQELSLTASNDGVQAALPLADALIAQDRWNPVARRVRFLSLFIDGEYASIIADAEACRAEGVDLLDCDFYAALAHARLGEWSAAQVLLEGYVQFARDLPEAWLLRKNLAEIYLAQGALYDARVLYARVLSENTHDADALAGLVAALVASGDFAEAESVVRDAMLTRSDNALDALPGTEWLVDGMGLPQQIVEARLTSNVRAYDELAALLGASDFGRSLPASVLQAFLDWDIRPQGRAEELLGIPCSVRAAAMNAERSRIAVLCDDRELRVGRVDGTQTSGWAPVRGTLPWDAFMSLAWTPDGSLRMLGATGSVWTWTSPTGADPENTRLTVQMADGLGRMTGLTPSGEHALMLLSSYGTEAYCQPADGSGSPRRVFVTYDYEEQRSTSVSSGCTRAAWLSGSLLWRTDSAGTPQNIPIPRLIPSNLAISADGSRMLMASGQTWIEFRDGAIFQSGQLPMAITSVRATPNGFLISAGQRMWWLAT